MAGATADGVGGGGAGGLTPTPTGGESGSGGCGSTTCGGHDALYRGPIQLIPEEHASRRERFAELDSLEPGWEVELRNKGAAVEASFFSPSGEKVGAFANARRMALAAHKALHHA